ncbi:hypothetical protein [Thermoactinomyces mirandus]|uniref:hypothetical protein n=1 Tax=Thermoactinomyces mirandus TaxID=2756294 RepID=UPI0015EFBE13|nr:hypothetical protein [Thermoactinomyces mirandus]
MDEATYLDELIQFMDGETDLIVFAEASKLGYARQIVLAYQPLVENQIFAVFQGQSVYTLAIPADLDEVCRFSEHYISPGWQINQKRLPSNTFPRVWRGTSQRPLAPLTNENLKLAPFYIGVGHYENEMVDMENRAAFNPFLHTDRMVMASADGGQVSQWYTRYSGSIFSIYRIPTEDGRGIFYLFVHYCPCPFVKGKQRILDQLSKEKKSAAKLPADVPVDVIFSLSGFFFQQLYTIEELKKEAIQGNYEWFIHLLGYLDCSLVQQENQDIEQMLADFACCNHQTIRQEVATLAQLHGWQSLLKQLEKQDVN